MMNRSPLHALLVFAALAAVALAQGGGGPGGGGPGGGPPPLPPVPIPAQNPLTPEKAVLGKILFWDEQLSSDNTMACGTCHIPTAGGNDPRVGVNPGLDGVFGTPDDKRSSPGMIRSDDDNDYLFDGNFGLDRQVTGRTAPTMINAAYEPRLFWDGRATATFRDPLTNAIIIPGNSTPAGGALESQAVGPPLSNAEMAHDNRDWAEITAKMPIVQPLKLASNLTPDIQAALNVRPTYPQLFQAAFGTPAITPARIAMAIASYERTLISNQTPWDLFNSGQMNALTPNQAQGLQVFAGAGRCDDCHTPPFFTDHTFRNIGVRPIAEDNGRQGVTGNPGDRGRFKVPSLRNVGLKPRFMHQGEFGTLAAVMNHYNNPGPFTDNRDPIMNLININAVQRAQLVDFVQNGLTDPRVAAGLPPFDRPTLGSESGIGAPVVLGPGVAGTGGFTPTTVANSPANIGNVDFKIGLRDALDDTLAVFALSAFANPPGSGVAGIPLYPFTNDPNLFITDSQTGGGAPGEGHATVRFPLPNLGVLAGFQFVTQWYVVDSGSAAAVIVSASDGLRFTIF